METRKLFRPWLIAISSLISAGFIALTVAGCTLSKKSAGNASASLPGAVDFSNGGPAYQNAVSQVNNTLNESEQYALTPFDLDALNTEGLLDGDDSAALNALVKQ